MTRPLAGLALLLGACAGAAEGDLDLTEPDGAEDAPLECSWGAPDACEPCPNDVEPAGCFELATIWRGPSLGLCSMHFACDVPEQPTHAAPDASLGSRRDGPMPPAEWCAANRCIVGDLTFAPAPGAEELTARAVQRLARATGLDVRVATAGVPVRFEEDLALPAGPVCGHTRWAFVNGGPLLVQWIVVDPTPNSWQRNGRTVACPSVEQTLLHELIHALAPESEHASSGLFAEEAAGSGAIDLPALLALCTEAPCAFMRPEEGTQ